MTQVGGPAALNGFLYQIFHHLGWLASVTLTGQLDGQDVENARLVLEPSSGGDARAEARGMYIVEQYKTRSDGTWSLSDIESVLRDLRRAVAPSFPASGNYRFVTDGRGGRLDTFQAFLADLRLADTPDDLDNANTRKFRNGFAGTNREFFEHIDAVTRSDNPRSNADERAVTFHLLSRFEMEFGASGDVCVAALERLLRRYAPDLGDESGIREQLVGVLLERLSKGETRYEATGIDALLQHVGLNPERLRRLAALAEAMSESTRRRLARLQYQAGRDVRSVPKWPESKPVLLIAGDSGVGKTWQLGRLLEACREDRYNATLVLAADDREDLLRQAARDVWQKGLGETSEKSLVVVSHFLRELEPDALTPRLIVALDDVRDIYLARDLVRQDWAEWDMRLVLTVPRLMAQELARSDGDTVYVHSVDDFSVEELDSLLGQSGRRWADLPSDLKILLRRPILAGLFLALPYSSVQSAPRSEYEIFDRFWQRITAKGKGGDKATVMALGAHVGKGKPYPLLRPMWTEIGLSDEQALVRLEATGWLRSTKNDEVAFAHDRLLNWAVAKSLVQQFERMDLSVDDLGAFLAEERGRQDLRVPSRLDYVPMDVVWLLAEDEQNVKTLGKLVAQMEDSGGFGSYGEALYVHLLPTLGERAVPILLERLNEITIGSEGDYRVSLIGKAVSTLVKQESVTLKDTVATLLKASSLDLQNVALAALTIAPSAGHLDRLWEIHQQRLGALADKSVRSRHGDYSASFAALGTGIEMDPGWLRNRILAADPENESVSELGYQLNALEHPDAPAIWQETGHVLISKVSVSKPRSLLYCIARFGDREKLDFVIQHLSSSEDFASSAALAALSVLDPLAAIDRLVEVGDSERYLTRDQWLPILLRAQPEWTRKRIRELTEADFKGCRSIVNLFWERPDQLDEAMLRLILRALEKELHEHLDTTIVEDPNWLYHPLDFLGRIARPELLAVLETEAGNELEQMITAVACSRLRTNSNYRDSIRENARRVLILMGGEGISTLIVRELESEHFWVRHGGLNWAVARTNPGIVERLTAIASRPILRDADGKVESDFSREFYQSTAALAALGADAALVEVLRNSGFVEVSIHLAQLRAHRGPMPKAFTEQTLRAFESAEASEGLLLTELVIAWISGDADLIPPARSVLERADPEGRVAAYACLALQTLGDSPDDFAKLADRLLNTEANSSRACQR